MFHIVAHRGVTAAAPENTMAAFAAALDLGVDAVELDIRLTRDHRAVVFHNYYLDDVTNGHGPVFAHTVSDLEILRIQDRERGQSHRLPLLEEVLTTFAGRLGLEIELKGPEPELADVAATLLAAVRPSWDSIEVTSFEPALLSALTQSCPELATALLFPLSEPWMRPDVVAYAALQRARLARARAVHLHPEQLSEDVVATIRARGVDVHAHSVNDERSLELCVTLGVPWVCTDQPERALAFRRDGERGGR